MLRQLNLHVLGPSWREKYNREKAKAVKRIEFSLKLLVLQRDRGAYFLMEHPAYTDSWKIEAMEEFMKLDGVATGIADQCMYGLTMPSEIDWTPAPARKPISSRATAGACCRN